MLMSQDTRHYSSQGLKNFASSSGGCHLWSTCQHLCCRKAVWSSILWSFWLDGCVLLCGCWIRPGKCRVQVFAWPRGNWRYSWILLLLLHGNQPSWPRVSHGVTDIGWICGWVPYDHSAYGCLSGIPESRDETNHGCGVATLYNQFETRWYTSVKCHHSRLYESRPVQGMHQGCRFWVCGHRVVSKTDRSWVRKRVPPGNIYQPPS